MKLLNYLNGSLSDNYYDEGKVVSNISIQRSNDYCAQYGKWLKLNRHQSILQKIHEASLNFKDPSSSQDPAINFLMIPRINGFALEYDSKRWTEEDFKYLFEYIAITLIEEHDFQKYSSTEETTRYFDRVEKIERYKLKNAKEDVDYSNILVRLCFIDNKISSIKLCVTCTKRRITNLSGLIQKIADA